MSSSNISLSVTVLTKNNELTIRQCLASVSWANEIIILDSGSTDQTLNICKEFTDNIHITKDWPGFGIQKNRALGYASGEWILSLDSDEVVTPALKEALQNTLQNPKHDHYEIRRNPYFLEKPIRFGSWSNDRPLRFFKRGRVVFDQAIIHESLIKEGKSGYLEQPIKHYTFSSIEEMLEKQTRYIKLGAEKRYKRGKRSNFTLALLKGAVQFLRTYVLKFGFLDGKEGLMIGIGNFYNTYYCNLLLWQMALKEKREGKQQEVTHES